MNVPDGRVIYTPVLTPSGGFKSDLTIMKMDDERFRVVTGGAHGMADKKWFADNLGRRRADRGSHVDALHGRPLGPARARHPRVDHERRRLERGASRSAPGRRSRSTASRCVASRISYVGDLGWELYVPMEHGAKLWDAVWEAGQPHGVVPAGIGVYGTTGRLEKAYRAFGFELDADYTVVEADMAWWKVKGEDFVGKEAHLAHREAEPVAKLCTLTIDDHTTSSGMKRYPLGREPRDAARRHAADRRARPPLVRDVDRRRPVARQAHRHVVPAAGARERGEQLAVEYMTELLPATVEIVGSTAALRPGERENPRRERSSSASSACRSRAAGWC